MGKRRSPRHMDQHLEVVHQVVDPTRSRLGTQTLGPRRALDLLHDQERPSFFVATERVHRHDIGMLESAEHACLAHQTNSVLLVVGVETLDGDLARKRRLHRHHHLGRAASAEHLAHLEAALPREQRQRVVERAPAASRNQRAAVVDTELRRIDAAFLPNVRCALIGFHRLLRSMVACLADA